MRIDIYMLIVLFIDTTNRQLSVLFLVLFFRLFFL